MTRSQLPDKARQPQLPISENFTRGHMIKKDYKERPHAAVNTEGLGQTRFWQARSQDVPGCSTVGSRNCRWIDQVEDQQSHWKLKRFSSWLKIQSVFQEPKLENKMTQERWTKRTRQLEEENLLAEMQASRELHKRRKTPEQKGASSTTVLEEENLSLKEQVRKLTEQVQLLMTSSQEERRARQRALRNGRGSLEDNEHREFWRDELARQAGTLHSSSCVGPVDGTTKTGACRVRCRHRNKNVQQHVGTRWDDKCHQARRHRQSFDRFNSQTIARDITGTIERPRHLWLSLRCGSYCAPTRTVNFGRTHKNRQSVRRGDVYDEFSKKLLNWHECKLDSKKRRPLQMARSMCSVES